MRVVLALLVLVAGCTADLGIAERCFPCVSDSQCGGGLICDQVAGACVRLGDRRCHAALAADAQPQEAGPIADSGSPDGGSIGPDRDGGPQGCGNGSVEGTEACDDGNAEDHDDCTNDCKLSCEIYVEAVAGWDHASVIRHDRSLWLFGRNRDGHLGDGTVAARFVPITTGGGRHWIQTSLGRYHTLALDRAGVMWVWGSNSRRQLGFSDTEIRQRSPVQFDQRSNWTVVAAGENSSFAQNTLGELWAWGENENAELGIGNHDSQRVPVQVAAGPFLDIDAGQRRTMALDAAGVVYLWGNKLALDDNAPPVLTSTPTPVAGLPPMSAMSLGLDHAMALSGTGQLWIWGSNSHGQLGRRIGHPGGLPAPVDRAGDWAAIEAGHWASYAIKRDGSLWSWGSNRRGGLGLGTDELTVSSPRRVPAVGNDQWVTISSDFEFAVGLQSDGSVWLMGSNNWGELGVEDVARSNVPIRLDTCNLD